MAKIDCLSMAVGSCWTWTANLAARQTPGQEPEQVDQLRGLLIRLGKNWQG